MPAMKTNRWNWRTLRTRLFTGLAVPAGVCLALTGRAAEKLGQPDKMPPAVVQQAPALGLAGYRALALEKQPALAAYRASAAAAEEKENALSRMRLAGLIRRDLPARREQAGQGVVATQAQVRKA